MFNPFGVSFQRPVCGSITPNIGGSITAVSDNVFFCATGITDGELLHGVRYRPEGQVTNSIVMRGKTGTIRDIRSEHRLDKLADYATAII